MSKILAPIKQRILKYVEFKGLTKGIFFSSLEVSPSNFRSKSLESEVGGDVIAKISSLYSDINIEWLLTGSGEMLKAEESPAIKELNPTAKPATTAVRIEPTLAKDKPIPLVKQQAVAGFGNIDFAIGDADVKDYYVVPKFKERKIDFMIEVSGSSMYPKYNSGDVVACKVLKESRALQWNKVHVIATTEQGILVKRIKKSKEADCLLMVSDNQDYDPFDLPKNEITGIALVVGVIRLE